jgi:hypothetical protein
MLLVSTVIMLSVSQACLMGSTHKVSQSFLLHNTPQEILKNSTRGVFYIGAFFYRGHLQMNNDKGMLHCMLWRKLSVTLDAGFGPQLVFSLTNLL